MREFKVNEYITIKLENNETVIYVNGEKFNHYKYLAFQIDNKEIEKYNGLQSIDAIEQEDRMSSYYSLDISPEEEFWGHCSNIQA